MSRFGLMEKNMELSCIYYQAVLKENSNKISKFKKYSTWSSHVGSFTLLSNSSLKGYLVVTKPRL